MRSAENEQQAAASTLRVRSKVWVEGSDGAVLISEYRADLLRAIREHGAVSEAASAVGLPYRTAWKKLEEMRGAAGAALVESSSGGSGGGRTQLTRAGEELLTAFDRLREPLVEQIEQRFEVAQERIAETTERRDSGGGSARLHDVSPSA